MTAQYRLANSPAYHRRVVSEEATCAVPTQLVTWPARLALRPSKTKRNKARAPTLIRRQRKSTMFIRRGVGMARSAALRMSDNNNQRNNACESRGCGYGARAVVTTADVRNCASI